MPQGQLASLLSPGSGNAPKAGRAAHFPPAGDHVPAPSQHSHQQQTVSRAAMPSGGHHELEDLSKPETRSFQIAFLRPHT